MNGNQLRTKSPRGENLQASLRPGRMDLPTGLIRVYRLTVGNEWGMRRVDWITRTKASDRADSASLLCCRIFWASTGRLGVPFSLQPDIERVLNQSQISYYPSVKSLASSHLHQRHSHATNTRFKPLRKESFTWSTFRGGQIYRQKRSLHSNRFRQPYALTFSGGHSVAEPNELRSGHSSIIHQPIGWIRHVTERQLYFINQSDP